VQEESQTIALVAQDDIAEVSEIEQVDLTQLEDDDNAAYDIDDIEGAIGFEEALSQQAVRDAAEFVPPPSTAPATLGGRPKRQRAHTEIFNEARRQGFLPESQPRE
jgi:hypothetical protein